MARLSLAYGLDPFAGELIIYQGRPYCTIDGRIRKAQEHSAYDGIECSPATDAERKSHRVADDEHFYIARVWRKDRRFPFVGYGRAAGKADSNPVSKTWGQEMAQKRAKSRALRDAFAMPLPDFEDNQSDRPPADYEPRYMTAGDVIEGESRVIDPDEVDGVIPVSDDNSVTGSQITQIHTLVSILKWEDAEYRGLLREAFDVESSTEMTEGQAAALTECLSSVLANAQEEGRKARMDEVVAALKSSAKKFRAIDEEGDPSWEAGKKRDAERLQEAKAQYTVLFSQATERPDIETEHFEVTADIKLGPLLRMIQQLEAALAEPIDTVGA